MRPLKLVLGVLLAIGLMLAGGIFVLSRYVRSAGFKAAVLDAAHGVLGADVRVGELRVSLFSGATFRQVAVANPPGFAGDLLAADALVIGYRIWPLLSRRLELDRVTLERPVLRLLRDEHGGWNYTKLGNRPATPGDPSARAPASPESTGPGGIPGAFALVLPALAVHEADVALLGARGTPLTRARDLDLTASLTLGASGLGGAGRVSVGALDVGKGLRVSKLASPLAFTTEEIRLDPLSGTLAGGTVSGDVVLRIGPAARYAVRLAVTDADVETLLGEAGATRRVVAGKLRGRATLEGSGGLQAATGHGDTEVVQGKLVDLPVLGALATALQTPSLAELRFDECRVEWTLADGRLQTPLVRLIARDLQVTGAGTVTLADASLDHRLTLAVSPKLFAQVPRQARSSFTPRPDGFMTMEFRLWGRYDAPRTDLTDRLVKGMAEGFLRRGLKQLLRK